jgi:signal peptidase I
MKNLLIWLLFIIGVLGAVYATPAFLGRILSTDNPVLTVTSQSMWPVLQRGDLILVKGAGLEDIEVGSVIVFRHSAGMAVHRVVKIAGQTITTKGDANTARDNPITSADIVGRVPTIGNRLVKIPALGRVALLMQPEAVESEDGEAAAQSGGMLWQMGRYLANPLGFTLLVLLPAVLLFGSALGDVISRMSPEAGRNQQRRKRAQRLEKRWGKTRAKRALGL